MRVRAAASQSHPADRGAGQRGPQPTRGRSAESVPGVSGGRGGRAHSGSSYSDVRCSVPSGPRVRRPPPWEPARSQDRRSVDAPPSGPFPGALGHSPPPAGGDPTHRSSRRARGGPPPRTPRSGTGAAGRTPSPVDAGGTREGAPARGPCPDPLMRPPEAKSLSSRSWTEAMGCGGPPSPGPLRSPWRELGTCGQRRAVTGESAPGSRLTLAGPQGRGARRRPGLGVTHPRAPRPPLDPDRDRLRAWPGSMINRRLWGPDRAQSA